MKRRSKVLVATLTMATLLFVGCGKDETDVKPTEVPVATEAPTEAPEPTATPEPTPSPTPAPKAASEWLSEMTLTDTMKPLGTDTPLMTQRFGADPCALVYDGRVYIYMTADRINWMHPETQRTTVIPKSVL